VIVYDGTIEYFIDNVVNYPTLSEAYKVAALNGYNRLSVRAMRESPESFSEKLCIECRRRISWGSRYALFLF
jgi:hypothetical protein